MYPVLMSFCEVSVWEGGVRERDGVKQRKNVNESERENANERTQGHKSKHESAYG